ncbi:MAG: hypothetical protein QW238_07610 [Candidatus Bathyarchaeia archaeon]
MLLGFRRFLLEAGRPEAWRRAAEDWRRMHPSCAICGLRGAVEVHDVIPYHLVEDPGSKPYEWWIQNFISLCHHDHHRLAHCGDPAWLCYNPRIRELASTIQSFGKFCRR